MCPRCVTASTHSPRKTGAGRARALFIFASAAAAGSTRPATPATCWARSSVSVEVRRNEIRSQSPVGSQIVALPASAAPKLVERGAPLTWLTVASEISRSCWGRRCAEPGDQRQDVLEHLPRHRDLGHLEGERAARAHGRCADRNPLV